MSQYPPQREPKTTPQQGTLKVAAAAAAAAAVGRVAYAAGSDTLKIGLVGCGGRGTADAKNSVNSSPGVVLWALADLFKDRLGTCRAALQKTLGDKMQVPDDRCFTGLDYCE